MGNEASSPSSTNGEESTDTGNNDGNGLAKGSGRDDSVSGDAVGGSTLNRARKDGQTPKHNSTPPGYNVGSEAFRRWGAREAEMKRLHSHFSKRSSARSAAMSELHAMLSQGPGSHEYASTTQSKETQEDPANKEDLRKRFAASQFIEQTLCNPNIPTTEVLNRFKTLSVGELMILYENYVRNLDRKHVLTTESESNVSSPSEFATIKASKSFTSINDLDNIMQPQVYHHSDADIAFMRSSMKSTTFFATFNEEELLRLTSMARKSTCLAGTKMIKEGDISERSFFIIKTGRFEIRQGGKTIKIIGAGDGVGELALFVSGRPRSASVVALEKAEVFIISQNAFWATMAGCLSSLRRKSHEVVKSCEAFSACFGNDKELVESVASQLFFRRFRGGETILHRGDVGSHFWILVEGAIEVKSSSVSSSKPASENASRKLQLEDSLVLTKPGINFGERSLITGERVSRSIVASGPMNDEYSDSASVLLAGLTKEKFDALPSSAIKMLDHKLALLMIKSHPCFKHLSEKDRADACLATEFRSFKHGDYLIRQGRHVSALLIIRRGVCEVLKRVKGGENEIKAAEVTVNMVLGEASLSNRSVAGASVVARGPVEVFRFPKALYERHLKSSPYLHEIALRRASANKTTIKIHSLSNLKQNDFAWLETLVGNRVYSSVRLVKHSKTKGYFTCRVVSKIFAESQQRHIRLVQERNILLTLHSNFCVKLLSTFQDLSMIYFLEEFLPGGTVLGLQQRLPIGQGLDSTTAAALVACVVLGLCAAHEHGVLVRALAPENLFIAANGLIKLTNFEFCKLLPEGDTTMTVCGSPEYMPPEQVFGHGQTLLADLWGLGCLVYELLTGFTPFADPENNIRRLQQNILKGINDEILEMLYVNGGPTSSVSDEHISNQLLKEIVGRLLKHKPTSRMSIFEIPRHAWFKEEGININELKSVGMFGNNLKTGKPLDVWWQPSVDVKDVARFYRDGDELISAEHGAMASAMASASNSDVAAHSIQENASEAAAAGSVELPWHWVF